MKTKCKINAGLAAVMILCLSGLLVFSAFTSPDEHSRAQLVLNIRDYIDKNVKPVMEPQRSKLDKMLSTDEKAQVSRLNAEIRELINRRNTTGIGFLASDEFSFTDISEFTPTQKAQMKADHDAMRKIMTQAWAIADKHENEIAGLLNEKSGNFKKWRNDMLDIVKKELDYRFFFVGGKQLVKRFENREIGKYQLPVVFLLWNPQQHFISDELLKKQIKN